MEVPFWLGLGPRRGFSEPLNLAEAQDPGSILPSLAYSSPFLLSGVRRRALLWSRAIAEEYLWAVCGEWSQAQQLREGALQERLGRDVTRLPRRGWKGSSCPWGHTPPQQPTVSGWGKVPQEVQVSGGRPGLGGL